MRLQTRTVFVFESLYTDAMASAMPADYPITPRRRMPAQQRSRERVERILEVAGRLIAEQGVEALTTRAVAAESGVPVASLYRYFADKNEILLALIERDFAEMDTRVAAALGGLDRLSVRRVIEAAMRAFVEVYRERPHFVAVWWGGRGSRAVLAFGRQHDRQIASALYEFLRGAGLIRDDAEPMLAELAERVGDRVFEFAFEQDPRGDERVIEEGIDLVAGYVERFATPAGLAGVPAKELGPR
jgi:AcrR family transcriptional regulator